MDRGSATILSVLLGAIGNGVELLMLDNPRPSPELALIAESVSAANARIRFLRVAFGVSGKGQPFSEAEIRALLEDRSSRIRVEWKVQGPLPRPLVRRAFLVLLCAETALPAGGWIRFGREGEAWHVEAEGRKLAPDPALWAQLSESGAEDGGLRAAQVQFGLLRLDLLAGPGLGRLECGDDRLRFHWQSGPA